MTVWSARMRVLLIVLALLLLGAAGAAAWLLVFADDGAEEAALGTAEAFTEAWERGDWRAIDELVADPEAGAGAAHEQQAEALAIDQREIALTDADLDAVADGQMPAAHRATHDLGELGSWTYESSFTVVQVDADEQIWRVDWRPQVLHPDLAPGLSFDRTLEWPERAEIVGRDGGALSGEGEVVIVGIEPRRVEDDDEIAQAIDELTPESEEAARAVLEADDLVDDWFYPIVTMPRASYDEVRDELRPIPGMMFQEDSDRAAASPAVAELVGRIDDITAEQLEELGPPYDVGDQVGRTGLEAALERELAGSPGTAIRLVDEDGSVATVLREWEADEPEDIAVTIDAALQDAAAQALEDLDEETAAALVAIDVDDGAVLAAVSRPLGGFDRALTGQYAPGSTFKIVTATALLDAGIAPGSEVSCPETITAGGRSFRNADDLELGDVDFTEAFARSCNTAFIGAAAELSEGALSEAAAAFGFGEGDAGRYDVAGRSAAASFPTPSDAAEEAAAAMGQGRVAASPVTMAGVAAAAAGGQWHQPHLLVDATPERAAIPEAAATALPDLMRAVVTDGTGTAAAVDGLDVIGKTGTAEHGDGDDHAWFVGAAGDTAFAVLVEEGGAGGEVAAPIAARFVERLP